MSSADLKSNFLKQKVVFSFQTIHPFLREFFQFLNFHPTITAKFLLSEDKNPHKFIISYNERKASTITTDFGLIKTKFIPLKDELSSGRVRRDSKLTYIPLFLRSVK
jgi:hypothetical protein